MAYLDATGRISVVTVLNHCVNTKEPASNREQLTNGKKGGTLYTSIYEELPQTKNIFNEVISIHIYFCFGLSFFLIHHINTHQ